MSRGSSSWGGLSRSRNIHCSALSTFVRLRLWLVPSISLPLKALNCGVLGRTVLWRGRLLCIDWLTSFPYVPEKVVGTSYYWKKAVELSKFRSSKRNDFRSSGCVCKVGGGLAYLKSVIHCGNDQTGAVSEEGTEVLL